jgi:hypothetical protein
MVILFLVIRFWIFAGGRWNEMFQRYTFMQEMRSLSLTVLGVRMLLPCQWFNRPIDHQKRQNEEMNQRQEDKQRSLQ